MMFAALLFNLTIAVLAIFLSLSTTEEIVKVACAFTAILSSFLSLFFAPWPLKILILALPFISGKLRRPRNLSGELES